MVHDGQRVLMVGEGLVEEHTLSEATRVIGDEVIVGGEVGELVFPHPAVGYTRVNEEDGVTTLTGRLVVELGSAGRSETGWCVGH